MRIPLPLDMQHGSLFELILGKVLKSEHHLFCLLIFGVKVLVASSDLCIKARQIRRMQRLLLPILTVPFTADS